MDLQESAIRAMLGPLPPNWLADRNFEHSEACAERERNVRSHQVILAKAQQKLEDTEARLAKMEKQLADRDTRLAGTETRLADTELRLQQKERQRETWKDWTGAFNAAAKDYISDSRKLLDSWTTRSNPGPGDRIQRHIQQYCEVFCDLLVEDCEQSKATPTEPALEFASEGTVSEVPNKPGVAGWLARNLGAR